MDGAQVWPTHAYVPGKTARHAEDAFEEITETAQLGMSPETLAQSAAFRHGLLYLDAGFYWEAHEAFEPVWMALDENSQERKFVQGLIQIANGLLKVEMGRPRAAARLLGIAEGLLPQHDAQPYMAVEPERVAISLEDLRNKTSIAI